LKRHEEYRVVVLDTSDSSDFYFLADKKIALFPIRANHFDLVSNDHCAGFGFHIRDRNTKGPGTVLIYTGDTGFDEELRKEYEQLLSERILPRDPTHPRPTVFLLAHIGGFKAHEKELFTSEDISKAYYPTHLGRIGLCRLVETVEPNAVLLSEFGEEFKNGCRKELVELYQKHYSDMIPGIIFLPMDNGFCMNLQTGEVEAICRKLDSDFISGSGNPMKVLGFIPHTQVSFNEMPPDKGHQLCYYDKQNSELEDRADLYRTAIEIRKYRIKKSSGR